MTAPRYSREWLAEKPDEEAFRYEDVRYASMDEDSFSGPLQVELRKFTVLKHTPKGFWIRIGFSEKRFVLTEARKKYAHLTKGDALTSFIARKRRQQSIYEARLNDCRMALILAEEMRQSQAAPAAEIR